ncbi:MAG: glycosyltransferase family 2 protein [Planctomycetes bacterium]|nr:glycosyltransferase family 2 protein [Planctomycetota bacterium]
MNPQDRSEQGIYLSIVAPAHNEMENLPRLLGEIAAALASCAHPWEVIITDDASTDGTPSVLQDLRKKYSQLRVLSMRRRSGQTAAVDAGLRHARGTFVATLDADLQNDPADIPRLLNLLEAQPQQCGFVNGWRANRHDPWIRLVSTRIANRVRNWLTHEQIHDSGCGLRVFRRECIDRVKLFNGMHRFLPTLVKMEGYQVMEVPVNHRPRTAGKAKYGVLNRVFKALRDAFAVRWMQQRVLRYECREWER